MIEWLSFTLLAVVVQALFALFEMACVSFNKIRLQYYVSLGMRRAQWLNYLLQRPSRLFGTTLIGINTALQAGSECARRFYESIHLDPDWAPITQVLIVVVLGELAPLFAARRHPEQIAMFLAPLMVFLARLLTPITWAFDQISKGIHLLMGRPSETPLFLSRDEVKIAFEEREGGEDDLNLLVAAVFQLKNQTAGQLMLPLSAVQLFPAHATVRDVREQLARRYAPIIPIFRNNSHNIVSIVNVRQLLRLTEFQKIIESGKSPWFVTKDTSVLQLLDQFRRNNQSVAVILEPSGQACGILTLDQIVDAIFGREELPTSEEEEQSHVIERTLHGNMSVGEFNRQFGASLEGVPSLTLSELILSKLDHPPARGEILRIGNYEFTITEPTLRSIRTLSVRTLLE